MKRSVIGRIDLLEVLDRQPESKAKALAKLLGYQIQPEKYGNTENASNQAPGKQTREPEKKSVKPLSPTDLTFWYAANYKLLEADKLGKKRIEEAIEPPVPVVIEKPTYNYISPWEKLEPRLRQALAFTADSNRLDIPKIVDQFGRGRIPSSLPYEQHNDWGSSLQVIDDRSKHMAPYLTDQAMVQRQLSQYFPGETLETAFLDAAFDKPLIMAAENKLQTYRPPAGGRVLVLSDLGCLARDGGRRRRFWIRFGRELSAAKCKVVVLLPCSEKQCSAELQSLYHLITWEHPAPPLLNAAQNDEACERLLQLLAPTWRFSPGLLRDLRLTLGGNSLPASVESLVWQQNATSDLNLNTSAMKPDEAMQRFGTFASLDNGLQKRVLKKTKAWHYDLPIEIWYSTLWNLPEKAQAVVDRTELQKAKEFLTHIANRSQQDSARPLGHNAMGWVKRNMQRLSDSAQYDPQLKEPIKVLKQALVMEQTPGKSVLAINGRLQIAHQGANLRISHQAGEKVSQGSPLFEINSGNGEVTLEKLPGDTNQSFWQTGSAPSWADRWNEDHYGFWVEFVIKGVRQRMRWINPGRFRMGSPTSEPGRDDDEGPQHTVDISQGYWLFDTPVTQALWHSVMGSNPSRFQSPDRPVEKVSWDDSNKFITKINNLVPELNLSLPSESQWEYACRSGTETALYNGEIEIIGKSNAPALDDIAWYGGNSGMEFELEDGVVSLDWDEKQYPHTNAGTHPVAKKRPNHWGLYDMLGNVWEWVEDNWHGNYEGAPIDGSAWVGGKASVVRVFRGGCWFDGAVLCRSACRVRLDPDRRGGLLGFRCARVQA